MRVVAAISGGITVILLLLVIVPLAFNPPDEPWLSPDLGGLTKICDVPDPADAAAPDEKQTTPVPDGEKGVAVPYLDGYSYLRGVNMYDLEALRRIDTSCSLNNPQASYTYLASRGMKIIRLAIPWERLQPVPQDGDVQAGMNAGLDSAYLAVVQTEVQLIENAGMRVILDLHNGGTYPSGPGVQVDGTVAFGDGISVEQAQHIWGMLSQVFKNEPGIAAYDLFNEASLTHMSASTYKQYTRAVVKTIRENGDQHTLWVEGMKEMTDGRLNVIASAGPWISDPLDKIVYSQHFYPGGTGSANNKFVVDNSYSTFTDQVTAFGEWCTNFSVHCSVGEVGWPSQSSQSASANEPDDWSKLGDKFYDLADQYDLDVTYFASTNGKQPGWLNAYTSTDTEGIDTAQSQASVVEKHPSR